MKKKAVNAAVRPTFTPLPPKPVAPPQPITEESLSEEEKSLAYLANSNGWRIISEYARGLTAGLEETNKNAIANGMDFAEIGKNTVVISLTRDIVDRIIHKVEDAREAVEATNGVK